MMIGYVNRQFSQLIHLIESMRGGRNLRIFQKLKFALADIAESKI